MEGAVGVGVAFLLANSNVSRTDGGHYRGSVSESVNLFSAVHPANHDELRRSASSTPQAFDLLRPTLLVSAGLMKSFSHTLSSKKVARERARLAFPGGCSSLLRDVSYVDSKGVSGNYRALALREPQFKPPARIVVTIFEETNQTFPASRAKIKPNCVIVESNSRIAHDNRLNASKNEALEAEHRR